MISLPDSDDVPVDLFLPPLVALLFLLLLVTYKNWLCILSSSKLLFLFCFFLKRSWRCNFPPNKRGRQRSWPCIFPPKNNPGYSTYAHLCKPMWNETLKPRAATRVFFGTLSCSFSLCSSLMFRLFATALNRYLWRGTSLLRRLFSRSISISLSLLYMFIDLFINWVCVLSYTSSSKFFFFLKRSWRCNFLPNKRGRQRSWPCIFPPKKTWFAAQGLSVSFHIAYMEERTYVRTLYGRSDGSDVITKPKFIALDWVARSMVSANHWLRRY